MNIPINDENQWLSGAGCWTRRRIAKLLFFFNIYFVNINKYICICRFMKSWRVARGQKSQLTRQYFLLFLCFLFNLICIFFSNGNPSLSNEVAKTRVSSRDRYEKWWKKWSVSVDSGQLLISIESWRKSSSWDERSSQSSRSRDRAREEVKNNFYVDCRANRFPAWEKKCRKVGKNDSKRIYRFSGCARRPRYSDDVLREGLVRDDEEESKKKVLVVVDTRRLGMDFSWKR